MLVSPTPVKEDVYDPKSCIVFLRTKEPFGWLSNMAAFPISLPGFGDTSRIRNAEALFQCLRFPDHPEIQRKILEKASPFQAKLTAHTHLEHQRPDWEDVKIDAMRSTLMAKWISNHNNPITLSFVPTDELPLVAESKSGRDSFWGAIRQKESGKLVGFNMLGKLLQEIRILCRAQMIHGRLPMHFPRGSAFLGVPLPT